MRAPVCLAAALAMLCTAPCGAQPAWKPERAVEIVVVSAPGATNDKIARLMQRIWQENKWIENVVVTNKVGGGGTIAYNYTNQRPGDAHTVAIARGGLLSNHILGLSPINYTDMTPIALMSVQAISLAVRADSPIKSVKDLVARWKADPQSVSISLGSTRGAPTQFVLAQIAESSGVDPRKLKTLTFGGGAESVTNLLGGHIDMASIAPGNVFSHHKAGTLRLIAIATKRRSAIAPDVPTLIEQGYDVTFGNWMAIVGPRGITPAQIAYWEDLLERTAGHPEWKRYLEADALEAEFMKSRATREYMRKDYETTRDLLTKLGMIKQ
jgi:putative tricarboxylic transport membrane protein